LFPKLIFERKFLGVT